MPLTFFVTGVGASGTTCLHDAVCFWITFKDDRFFTFCSSPVPKQIKRSSGEEYHTMTHTFVYCNHKILLESFLYLQPWPWDLDSFKYTDFIINFYFVTRIWTIMAV